MANGEEQDTSREIGWADIASPGWYPVDQLGTIWVTAYVAMATSPIELANGVKVVDFGDARAVLLYGRLPYVRATTTEVRSVGPAQFVARVDQVTASEGAYLLVVLPFDDANPSRSELRCRARTSEVIGLMIAVFGPNIAYDYLFDNIVWPQANQRSVFGDVFRAPSTMPAPDTRQRRIDLALAANAALAAASPNEANRALLSLRWYKEAHQSRGVDIFLKLWFAIEALGMAPRDNLSPVAQNLALAYSISPTDAKEGFALGPLFGFRSRIVHQGEIRPIHALLSDYMAALYRDVLFQRLGLASGHAAGRVREQPGFSLDSYLA